MRPAAFAFYSDLGLNAAPHRLLVSLASESTDCNRVSAGMAVTKRLTSGHKYLDRRHQYSADLLPELFAAQPQQLPLVSICCTLCCDVRRARILTLSCDPPYAPTAPASEVPKESPLILGALFGGWYAFNIYFNM